MPTLLVDTNITTTHNCLDIDFIGVPTTSLAFYIFWCAKIRALSTFSANNIQEIRKTCPCFFSNKWLTSMEARHCLHFPITDSKSVNNWLFTIKQHSLYISMLFSTKLFIILWAEAVKLAADTSVWEGEHIGISSLFFSLSIKIPLLEDFLLGAPITIAVTITTNCTH